jgi:hypothetical protein
MDTEEIWRSAREATEFIPKVRKPMKYESPRSRDTPDDGGARRSGIFSLLRPPRGRTIGGRGVHPKGIRWIISGTEKSRD